MIDRSFFRQLLLHEFCMQYIGQLNVEWRILRILPIQAKPVAVRHLPGLLRAGIVNDLLVISRVVKGIENRSRSEREDAANAAIASHNQGISRDLGNAR